MPLASFSMTCFTAFITIFPSSSFVVSSPTFFEPIETMAIFWSICSSFMSTFLANSSRVSLALTAAILYPLITVVGCIPWSSRSPAPLSSSPASMTTLVVPSPTSLSWVLAMLTIILATGCSTFISWSIVAPSFVMTTSPRSLTIILSIPFGPSVVFTAPATATATAMLVLWASLPRSRVEPSGRRYTCCPPS